MKPYSQNLEYRSLSVSTRSNLVPNQSGELLARMPTDCRRDCLIWPRGAPILAHVSAVVLVLAELPYASLDTGTLLRRGHRMCILVGRHRNGFSSSGNSCRRRHICVVAFLNHLSLESGP
jgi:hypothetical protein